MSMVRTDAPHVRAILFAEHPGWQEVLQYLGGEFCFEWCNISDATIREEYATYPDAETFYRETTAYCYNGLIYFLEGWKRQWYAHLFHMASGRGRNLSVLDYGCGSGCDGLLFLEANMHVGFADVESRSLDFLRWRLWARRTTANVYSLPSSKHKETVTIPSYDVVWCMDVLEHLPPTAQKQLLLETLPEIGNVVFVNLVSDSDADGTVHHPVDYEGLTQAVRDGYPSVFVQDSQQTASNLTRLLIYGT